MTPDEMRIAIAEACGWRRINDPRAPLAPKEFRVDSIGQAWTSLVLEMPNYLSDLNAMHEAETFYKNGNGEQYKLFCQYCRRLDDMLGPWAFHATARQRAEAFLRTLFPERFK